MALVDARFDYQMRRVLAMSDAHQQHALRALPKRSWCESHGIFRGGLNFPCILCPRLCTLSD